MAHLYTIGHSTRSIEEFLGLLREHGIGIVVDIRRWPGSRRNPHFNSEALARALRSHGIEYEWLGEQLGGWRKEGLGEGSPNRAWRSEGFRNYADHTMTAPFEEGVRRLLELASRGRVAVMCAERLHWRCHRSILSDYLMAKGHSLTHIIDKGEARDHELTRFAKVANGELSYPGP
ncbi:MAG: DUF488 domain-containing protein [Candidatus Bathyarchaeia archaeon]